ncbi:hypothetical protein [Nocardia macrotermitis]|uniref:WXG100 family type VII secretion target n=1 Tax=Nocardia macrotermitis TaxID=2585198 RepID=A0A7K0DG49_9NOCA|nr:hypothetical protein [Nocardia macrotermitis]MQY24282.1 hypothetical protein [Nocardia macrotermitis]
MSSKQVSSSGSGSFDADPVLLRAMQPQFAELSTQMSAAVQALTEVTDREGECWGTDKPGAAFAKDYVSAAKSTQDSLGVLVKVMSTLGDNMATIATKLTEQDASSATALTQQTTEI